MPTPTESAEQKALFEWAIWQVNRYPGLELMHHIPNGGLRSKSEAARFKREGVKAGIPDIFLPVPRGKYHGLYIELKRIGGSLSSIQEKMILQLEAQGYCVVVCYGFDAAAFAITEYYENNSGR